MPPDPAPRDDAAARAPRSPLGRVAGSVLRALAPLVVLLVLLELVLAAFGLGARSTSQDLSRGFDPSVAYVRPDPDTGGHRTQMFDDPSREVALPPKGERPRVLLFGGSNTQQLWAPLIELAFREAGVELEVINLGREGYGSARVVILLEQALVSRPDLVLLYTGHNEFIERVFRQELADAEGGARSWFARAARSLRSYRLLVDALRPAPALWSEPAPDAARPPDFDGQEEPLTRAQVDERYAVYRANLERMVALSEAAGARVVLSTLVGNMLAPPYTDAPADAAGPELHDRRRKLRGRALALIPERFDAVFHPPLRVRVQHWYAGPGWQGPAPAPRPRTLLGALADTRATAGGKTESVDGAHWPDPALWGPNVAQLMAGVDTFMERALQPGEREAVEQALAQLDEALAPDAHAPRLHFDRGLCLWLLGRDDEAVESFDLARDTDSQPGSATRTLNALVRDVAADHPDALLLDADALFRERSPDGLIAFELLMDHCHLQPGARVLLMQDMAARIVSLPR